MTTQLKKKQRYQNFLQTDKTIILTTDKKSKVKNIDDSRILFRKYGCKIYMFLKRYFYKLYIGERNKNQKINFENNMYLLCCNENFEFEQTKKLLKKLHLSIKGVLINNKYYGENYNIFINSGFNKNNMIILILLSLTKLFAITISLKKNVNKNII